MFKLRPCATSGADHYLYHHPCLLDLFIGRQGEIYALRHNPGEPPQVVEGDVLLVRAPTVDVGDVQFAKAVGTPPPGAERFKHLPNVVIFSVQGTRPLLTSLARGDMDGDLVGVISDRRLFPRRTEPPMQHKPKTPVDLDYDCTINEVIDFVLRFFRNDILGSIASRVGLTSVDRCHVVDPPGATPARVD